MVWYEAPSKRGIDMPRLAIRHDWRRRLRNWYVSRPLTSSAVLLAGLFVAFGLIEFFVHPTGRARQLVDSVFGGLLASLAAYGLIRYIALEKEHLALKAWLRFGRRRVIIVPTSLEYGERDRYDDPRYGGMPYYVMPPFDAMATGLMIELARRSGSRYPHRRTIGSHDFERRLLRENIVTMCLPIRNQYSRLFLGLLHEIYCDGTPVEQATTEEAVARYLEDTAGKLNYFGLKKYVQGGGLPEHWRMRDFAEAEPNRWKTSSLNRDGAAAHRPDHECIDRAMVVLAPNPFNPKARVLIACGIHGVGTFGAALWIYEQSAALVRKYPDEAQAHSLEVAYRVPQGKRSYVDAELLTPIRHVSWIALNPGIWSP